MRDLRLRAVTLAISDMRRWYLILKYARKSRSCALWKGVVCGSKGETRKPRLLHDSPHTSHHSPPTSQPCSCELSQYSRLQSPYEIPGLRAQKQCTSLYPFAGQEALSVSPLVYFDKHCTRNAGLTDGQDNTLLTRLMSIEVKRKSSA